ncbi:MAG TPA: hypothetical protein DCZ95_06620 [Verrucomicrobia bacterium]|nr:hypothetical protein [Verrucomicrobiota bacterium]
MVNSDDLAKSSDKEALLASVLQMTSDHWQGSVECDLAAVFDQNGCGLKCMTRESFDPMLCSNTIDCMGIFKTTHGFNGFVTGCQIDCRKMYPLMTIWTKQE